jgi:hypothetical protein
LNAAGKPVNLNAKVFQTEPALELKDQTYAYQWEQRRKPCQKIKIADQIFYCIPAGTTSTLSKKQASDYLKSIKELKFDSFDELIQGVNSVRVVQINEQQWKLSTCTCSWWSKNYICNHVIALSQRLGHFEFVDAAKTIPVTQNRKRGRPANTEPARVKQRAETQETHQQLEIQQDDQESEVE